MGARSLQAMLFTLWVPPQHLPGRAGMSPRFIEIPPATTTQKPMPADRFVTLPGDAEKSTKRQRQEEIPR